MRIRGNCLISTAEAVFLTAITAVTMGPSMMSPGQSNYCTDNDVLLKELKQQYLDKDYPEKINGKLILSKRKPAILRISSGGHTVTAEGMQSQMAQNRPLTRADLEKQMRKTGGSGFAFSHLEIDTEDDLFLPMQALNELRRNAITALKEDIQSEYRRGGRTIPETGVRRRLKGDFPEGGSRRREAEWRRKNARR